MALGMLATIPREARAAACIPACLNLLLRLGYLPPSLPLEAYTCHSVQELMGELGLLEADESQHMLHVGLAGHSSLIGADSVFLFMLQKALQPLLQQRLGHC